LRAIKESLDHVTKAMLGTAALGVGFALRRYKR
jgi:hypothetical protein